MTRSISLPGDFSADERLPSGEITHTLAVFGWTWSGFAIAPALPPLIQNSLVFTLALPSTFSATNYTPTNVYFQYGTSLVSVPEPATLLLQRKKPTQLS
jgi:hypothetical protein